MDVSSASEVEMGKRGLHWKKEDTSGLLKLAESINTYTMSKRMCWILVTACNCVSFVVGLYNSNVFVFFLSY